MICVQRNIFCNFKQINATCIDIQQLIYYNEFKAGLEAMYSFFALVSTRAPIIHKLLITHAC